MRFGPNEHPKEGDLRDRSGFLLFPKTIAWKDVTGRWVTETRWLERAMWREMFHIGFRGVSFWRPIRWCDELLERIIQ